MGGAAELFTRHVFLDLETTGLDPRVDEVIELGCLFYEGGREVDRFARLYAPSTPLPLAIRRLTGLTDADLAGRPRFGSDLEELRERLSGWTVVAHNAPFEKGFLPDLLNPLRARVLDSCELMHYLHPELSSHSLESLLRWAGLEERPRHRAMADCEAVHAVLVHTLEGCLREGRAEDVADLLATLDPRIGGGEAEGVVPEEGPLLELLAGLALRCRESGVSAAPMRPRVVREREVERVTTGTRPSDAVGQDAPLRTGGLEAALTTAGVPVSDAVGETVPLRADELEAALGAAGALERADPTFRSHAGPLQVALAVAHTLTSGGSLAVESGPGRPLAWLTPTALFAARNRVQVAVAAPSPSRQSQLMEKDLPRLSAALGEGFRHAALREQPRYLCRRRTLEATRVEPDMDHAARAPRAYLRAVLRRSPEGDVAKLSRWFQNRFPSLPGLLPAVRSEEATTLEARCPHFQRCYFHTAVARAREADVLVVPTSVALDWPARYPRVDRVVLEDAHTLEDAATTAGTLEFTDSAFARLSERLVGREGRRGLFTELRRTLAAQQRPEARERMVGLDEALRRVQDAAKTLGERLTTLCGTPPATKGDDPEGASPELWVTEEVRALPVWPPVLLAVDGVGAELRTLHALLDERLPRELPALEVVQPALEREVSGALADLGALLARVRPLTDRPERSRCLIALAEPRRQRWSLKLQPVEVDLSADSRALVLVSPTLGPDDADGTPFVVRRLGLEAPRVRGPSPFRPREQALVVLVSDAPRAHEEPFMEWAANGLVDVAQSLGGRLLGLFASSGRMERVGRHIESRLAALDIEVLRQARDPGRPVMVRQSRSVVLGTRQSWRAVELPGRGGGCLFLDALPMEPPRNPLFDAREEAQGFPSYRLPRALLMLREALERLPRAPQDRTVVLVADPGHPGYRDALLSALEGHRVESHTWEDALLATRTLLGAPPAVAAAPLPA